MGSSSYKENLYQRESWCSVVWLGVKPVGALVMENRCGNGLVLRLYPTALSPLVMKNNGCVPKGRGPLVTFPAPPLLLLLLCPHSLHWVCWQANRWRGWVASGLCALSVIKEKKRFMAYLLVSRRLMGCQVSMLRFQISWGWWRGGGKGEGRLLCLWAWAAICHCESSPLTEVSN